MGTYSQALRLGVVSTSHGVDSLLLERFTLSARLNEPFLFLVNVLSEQPQDFSQALYGPVTVRTAAELGAAREFNGTLLGVERLPDSEDAAHYQLIVRPWLAVLAERYTSRIFQNKSATDIVKDVFAAAGMSDFTLRLTGQYPKREYCVQYRESDLAFVSRLLEDEGICYFFEHRDGRCILVLSDHTGGHQAPPALPELRYLPPGHERGSHMANAWRWTERLTTAVTKTELSEYSFLKPDTVNLSEARQEQRTVAYDHPSGLGGTSEAEVIERGGLTGETRRLAQARLDAARAETRKYYGETDAVAIDCGCKVKLAGVRGLEGDYTIVAATHVFGVNHYRSGGDAEEAHLEVHVEAIPHAVRWRPPRRTPKPFTGGPQTAVVVGPLKNPGKTDDTIHVDKHGRVKVQFFWDRDGKWDPKSSCWVRVSQGWADGGFGAVLLPRIGQEVIIDFLDGDPDRPIITGRVYNAAKTLPYELPKKKTVSTLKSRTVGVTGPYPEAEEPPAGNDIGYNELRFDDDGGKEEIYLHAQRDMNSWVRLDEKKKVGRDVADRVGRNRETRIKKHETLIVETGDEKHEVQKGSRSTKIQKDETLVVAKGDMSETIQTGNLSVKISKGKATIEAMQSIELKVGPTKIKMTPSGIEMTAMTIKIDAKTALAAKGGVTTEVKAGVMMTINGAMVMIN